MAPKAQLISLSLASARRSRSCRGSRTAPTRSTSPCTRTSRDDDYLLFLGRMSAEKGAHRAMRSRRGRPAAQDRRQVPRAGRTGVFRRATSSRTSGTTSSTSARCHGEKVELLQRARATIFPIEWEEPFGLVMIESMACGTPVIATRWGAVPEVIDDGGTGIIVDDSRRWRTRSRRRRARPARAAARRRGALHARADGRRLRGRLRGGAAPRVRLRSPVRPRDPRLAVPALGSLAAEPLYLLVDTAIVGHLGRLAAGGARDRGDGPHRALRPLQLPPVRDDGAGRARLGAARSGSRTGSARRRSGSRSDRARGRRRCVVGLAPQIVELMGGDGRDGRLRRHLHADRGARAARSRSSRSAARGTCAVSPTCGRRS